MEIKDYIYFGGILVAVLSSWFKIKHETEKQNDKLISLAKNLAETRQDLKDNNLESRKSRSQIRRDFEANLQSNNLTFSSQFTEIDEDIKDLGKGVNKMNLNIQDLNTKMELLIKKLEL
jgi:hypothetical protein